MLFPVLGPYHEFGLDRISDYLPDVKHLITHQNLSFALGELKGVVQFPSFHTVMALGAYGYDWTLPQGKLKGSSEAVTFTEATNRLNVATMLGPANYQLSRVLSNGKLQNLSVTSVLLRLRVCRFFSPARSFIPALVTLARLLGRQAAREQFASLTRSGSACAKAAKIDAPEVLTP